MISDESARQMNLIRHGSLLIILLCSAGGLEFEASSFVAVAEESHLTSAATFLKYALEDASKSNYRRKRLVIS